MAFYGTVVTLNRSGDEPRERLRYEFEEGATEQVEIILKERQRLETRMADDGDEIDIAVDTGFTLLFEWAVDQVAGDLVHYSGTYMGFDIGGNNADAVRRAATEQILAFVEDAEFSGTMTRQGIPIEADYVLGHELGEPFDEAMQKDVAQAWLEHPLRYVFPVLSEEPVGNNGEWVIEQTRPYIDAGVDRRQSYRLDRSEDRVVVVVADGTFLAEDQELFVDDASERRLHLVRREAEDDWRTVLSTQPLKPTENEIRYVGKNEIEVRVRREVRSEIRSEHDITLQVRVVE